MDLYNGVSMNFSSVDVALDDLRAGQMVIVLDDENRENEGDLIIAAQFATPQAINFMITHARGLVCMPMMAKDLARLNLPQMVATNTDNHHTAFSVSVDHASTTTGISAHERSATIHALISQDSAAEDFRKPGHIFPLQARDGGVLQRRGHTEAAVDLCRLAGLHPAGVICEITNDDGTMARLPQLRTFALKWHLHIITIADLVKFLRKNQSLVQRETEINLPTRWGNFTVRAYSSPDSAEPHLALIKGDPTNAAAPLCRVHSECLTGDLLGSLRCDCGDQLHEAMTAIDAAGCGILIYLRQEGRGIGLLNKLKAYALQQNQGLDTVEANIALGFAPELRDFKPAADILKDCGVSSVTLMTNNPLKIDHLEQCGIAVQRKALEVSASCQNQEYLRTKRDKMGHILENLIG